MLACYGRYCESDQCHVANVTYEIGTGLRCLRATARFCDFDQCHVTNVTYGIGLD